MGLSILMYLNYNWIVYYYFFPSIAGVGPAFPPDPVNSKNTDPDPLAQITEWPRRLVHFCIVSNSILIQLDKTY